MHIASLDGRNRVYIYQCMEVGLNGHHGQVAIRLAEKVSRDAQEHVQKIMQQILTV
jgi:ferritin-like protein